MQLSMVRMPHVGNRLVMEESSATDATYRFDFD